MRRKRAPPKSPQSHPLLSRQGRVVKTHHSISYPCGSMASAKLRAGNLLIPEGTRVNFLFSCLSFFRSTLRSCASIMRALQRRARVYDFRWARGCVYYTMDVSSSADWGVIFVFLYWWAWPSFSWCLSRDCFIRGKDVYVHRVVIFARVNALFRPVGLICGIGFVGLPLYVSSPSLLSILWLN